uniref:Prepilin-type N-terminal cleavage/methylation domain protein n=1 Tax=Stigmatella aurantiaca Sg a15 TaxID=675526 RepID=A0A3S7UU64_STIAU|nr:prepilin-type N-terminal cleavage/methylation domain protein [Stigmatella aurantiaca Sg a15]
MRPSRRGFTLIELLVGGAVGAVVLLGISLTFISQARQYQTHASRRAIQSNARQAMSFMTRNIRAAGYGVNPDRAVMAYDSYNASADAAQNGYPDALVVHSRDLLFRRDVTAADPSSLTVDTPIPLLHRGQILLVLCRSATTTNHAFVTVGQRVENSSTIPLDPTDPSGAPNSPTAMPGRLFHEQNLLNANCYDTAQVVKVNRAAFYVDAFAEPGNDRRTPYLMMHQGLDLDNNGTIDSTDSVPIAEGIEQLQIAYILNLNITTTGNKPPLVVGVNEATPSTHYGEQWQTLIPTQVTARGAKWYMAALTSTEMAAYEEDSPVNIRQVRLTLVSRSSMPDQQHRGDDLMLPNEGAEIEGITPWRQLENLSVTGATADTNDFTPQAGGFYRAIFREAVTTKNLQLSSQFVATTESGG